ncbi:ABC-type multidrug transport system, membrane fusion protein [Candidatus Gastranaerophilus sp. (ex Termes propinquus)]|nr:ABC-type multidrug transport system, membrane fusion protein [Candidatus Gastranaerophilus sp. (ex Termes propinquus)]
MKKLIIIGIVAAIISVVAIIILFVKKEFSKNKHELTLFGNIEIRQVDLGFRVAGRVKEMYFEEGDFVKAGQLLALLDDAPHTAIRDRNTAQVERDRAVYFDAKSQYDRNTPLCADETVSQQECTTFLNTKDQTKGAYEASQAALREAETDLKDTRIFSPSDGIITTRIQEPGAIVSNGQPVYTLSKTTPVWVRAFVSEPDLANIKYGMKAHVLTDTINPKTQQRREYTGWVGYISPVAEFTPKTVQTEELRTDLVYRIRVYIYETDAFLRQGMPTTVKIDLLNSEVR